MVWRWARRCWQEIRRRSPLHRAETQRSQNLNELNVFSWIFLGKRQMKEVGNLNRATIAAMRRSSGYEPTPSESPEKRPRPSVQGASASHHPLSRDNGTDSRIDRDVATLCN